MHGVRSTHCILPFSLRAYLWLLSRCCSDVLRWVWSPTGGWWVQPRHWMRNTAIVGTGIACIAVYAYNWATERESWINDADQTVHYSDKDQRAKLARKENRAKQQALLDYQKEHGQRPTTAHYD